MKICIGGGKWLEGDEIVGELRSLRAKIVRQTHTIRQQRRELEQMRALVAILWHDGQWRISGHHINNGKGTSYLDVSDHNDKVQITGYRLVQLVRKSFK